MILCDSCDPLFLGGLITLILIFINQLHEDCFDYVRLGFPGNVWTSQRGYQCCLIGGGWDAANHPTM